MPRTFPRPSQRTLPALAFALAMGAGPLMAGLPQLPRTELASIKAQQPARVAQAQNHLTGLRAQLGLSDRSGFVAHHPFTDEQGRTVARFYQTHAGHRVWGGAAIVHTEADGTVKALTQGLRSNIPLAEATPRLSAEDAKAIAFRNLAPKGPRAPQAKVERVVFPTQFTGGLAFRYDASKGARVFDPEMSLAPKVPSQPFTWAYEVRTFISNQADGHKEMSYIIDADTGAILRKWNEVQPLAAVDAPGVDGTPAVGVGHSYFRGTVPLDTVQAPDLTYALVAKNRGTQPQPYFQSAGITQTGLTTCYGATYPTIDPMATGFEVYTGNPTNEWGDGTLAPLAWDTVMGGTLLDFNGDGSIGWLRGALTPAGQTTAVDSHFGLSTTWDFYKNVFNRDGIDNAGTSTFSIVHTIDSNLYWNVAPMLDNAYWAPWYFGMVFGEGAYPAFPDHGVFKVVTELDITGHELTHGVTQESAHLIYDGQSGGLNEATSDCLGKMVQAYADGGATGSAIPTFAAGDLAAWEVGRNSTPSGALRFMYMPSKDGISADEWYDGIDGIDVHFNSGPVNRFFFFLAMGASPDRNQETYSPYLPGGMTGLGNEKAARIWYRALTQYMVEDTDFAGARVASLSAAQDLYGQAEVDAVMKAWAAVNVGSAPGQPARVRVQFPVPHGAGTFLGDHAVPTGVLGRTQIFPISTSVKVEVSVENTPDKQVVMGFDNPMMGHQAGTFSADGRWITPNFTFYMDLLPMVATSHADPLQYAKASMLLANLDGDLDSEQDALDLGMTAMVWNCPNAPQYTARTAGMGNDWDLVFFTEAFVNAWPVK